jgi:hypothetical protein
MYATCTFCYGALGRNDVLASFPVAQRVAFDPRKGCLWAVCPACARWNLAPLEERWEAVEECELRYRATALRYTVGNIGLAWIHDALELVRVGPALRPEVAAWRYGRTLMRRRPVLQRAMREFAAGTMRAMGALRQARNGRGRDARAAVAELVLRVSGNRVLDIVGVDDERASDGNRPVAVVRYRHLLGASLGRPENGRPWALHVPHDHGLLSITGDQGIRAAARMLAVVNGSEHSGGFSRDLLEAAVRKVDESARPESYFNRVLAIALRSDWGRSDSTVTDRAVMDLPRSDVERMAFRLTGRTFWGHGGIGSEPRTALLDVPLVDRLALEMAAHEEAERRALDGELDALAEAWREADEIASIADVLLTP